MSGPDAPFSGKVDTVEKYLGSRKPNMNNQDLRSDGSRGDSGKMVVAGLNERGSKHITVRRVRCTTKGSLQGFVRDNVVLGTTVYTNEPPS